MVITTIQVSAWTDWIKQKIKLSDSKEGKEEIAADEEEIGADEGEFAKFFNSYK